MTLARVSAGPTGFEYQAFECRSCDYSENVVVALDPMNANALGSPVRLGQPRDVFHNCPIPPRPVLNDRFRFRLSGLLSHPPCPAMKALASPPDALEAQNSVFS